MNVPRRYLVLSAVVLLLVPAGLTPGAGPPYKAPNPAARKEAGAGLLAGRMVAASLPPRAQVVAVQTTFLPPADYVVAVTVRTATIVGGQAFFNDSVEQVHLRYDPKRGTFSVVR